MVNGVSTRSMNLTMGIPSGFGSHRVHLTREGKTQFQADKRTPFE